MEMPRRNVMQTLANGEYTLGLGFTFDSLNESHFNGLKKLTEDLEKVRLDVLSLLAETSKDDFVNTRKKEESRNHKMGEYVILIASILDSYDQDENIGPQHSESNYKVSYDDPNQDSMSNSTLNSKDTDSNGVQSKEDSNEIQRDSKGIPKDSNGDQESPRRCKVKEASPYLPSPEWSRIPFYSAVSGLVLNLDKQIHGTNVLISLLQREKT